MSGTCATVIRVPAVHGLQLPAAQFHPLRINNNNNNTESN